MWKQESLRAEKAKHNFDLNPVGATFYQCEFPSQSSLGLKIVPRHLKYETCGVRKNVSCCTVVSSTRPEILPGDILVRVNEVLLIGPPSTELDDFFSATMKSVANARSPRVVLFLKPSGSSAYYITGLSTALIISLDSEEESLITSTEVYESAPHEHVAPIAGPVTSILTVPAVKSSVAAPKAPKIVYRSEEEEIERKVEEQMRSIAAALNQAKLKRIEDEARVREEKEFERIVRLELVRKTAEDDARRTYEIARSNELMRIDEARKAAEAVRATEEIARAKRVAEAVQRRVEDETRRLAEEQEVLLMVEIELARITELKNREEDEARAERVADQARRRVQEEIEKMALQAEMQRIADEEELIRCQEEAKKKADDDERYAADEAVRRQLEEEADQVDRELRMVQMKIQLEEQKIAAEIEARLKHDADEVLEAERVARAIEKAAYDKARESRVAEEVQRRVAEEKKRVLGEIEKRQAEDEALIQSAKKAGNSHVSSMPKATSIDLAAAEPVKQVSAEEKIRNDAIMEQWLQEEVKKRVSDEVKKRVDMVSERRSGATLISKAPIQAPMETNIDLDPTGSTAVMFETTFPDNQPLGLTLIPHTVLFTTPLGEVRSIHCCMVASSTLTSDIQQTDIAVSINNMSLMSVGTATNTVMSNFEVAMRTVTQPLTQRTVRFLRADRPVSEDGATSSLPFSDASVMIQNDVK